MTKRRLTAGEVRNLDAQLDLLQNAITRGEITASAATLAMLTGARVGLLVASGGAGTEDLFKLAAHHLADPEVAEANAGLDAEAGPAANTQVTLKVNDPLL